MVEDGGGIPHLIFAILGMVSDWDLHGHPQRHFGRSLTSVKPPEIRAIHIISESKTTSWFLVLEGEPQGTRVSNQ